MFARVCVHLVSTNLPEEVNNNLLNSQLQEVVKGGVKFKLEMSFTIMVKKGS